MVCLATGDGICRVAPSAGKKALIFTTPIVLENKRVIA